MQRLGIAHFRIQDGWTEKEQVWRVPRWAEQQDVNLPHFTMADAREARRSSQEGSRVSTSSREQTLVEGASGCSFARIWGKLLSLSGGCVE